MCGTTAKEETLQSVNVFDCYSPSALNQANLSPLICNAWGVGGGGKRSFSRTGSSLHSNGQK